MQNPIQTPLKAVEIPKDSHFPPQNAQVPQNTSEDLFNCWVCHKSLPKELVENTHHTRPQAYGGANGITKDLCASCHDALHAASKMLTNPKKAGKVKDLVAVYLNNDNEAIQRLLELANFVNKFKLLKQDNQLDDLDEFFEENVGMIALPKKFKLVLARMAHDHRGGTKKALGLMPFIKFILLGKIAQEFPALREEINRYLHRKIEG